MYDKETAERLELLNKELITISNFITRVDAIGYIDEPIAEAFQKFEEAFFELRARCQ